MPILQAGEARVHVQEAGDGPPVLLLHASTSSGGQWRDLQAMLAGEFRTLAPDLLGYGKTSPWDPSRELSSEHELALLDAVVAHAGGGPIHLVGHSYGGLTALRLAASGRAPLASLTLVEPIAFWLLRLAGEAELYGEMRGVADAFVAAWRRGDVDGAAGPYIDYWNGPGAWERLPDGVRAYARATAGKTSREWAPAFEADMSLGDLAAALPVPPLVIHGSATNRTTRRICALIRGAVPGARGVEIPGGGHMCPLTHSPLVNMAIARHLRRAEAARSGERAAA